MNVGKTLFAQVMEFVPWKTFGRIIERHKGDSGVRTLGCADLFRITAFSQLTWRESLRDIEVCLEANRAKLFHMGIAAPPARSTLADALTVARQRCWRHDWVIDLDIRSFFDEIDREFLMRAVRRHTDCAWVLLYIERWLQAPVSMPDGTLENRDKGTPQGSVVSPILANLFLHYAFDTWMRRKFPACPFERYADDAIIHCDSEHQARQLLDRLRQRFAECGLELHPQKTRIVYCKDANRHGNYPELQFDFLGHTFRPRGAMSRAGQMFVSFIPAVSAKATKSMRSVLRRWKLSHRGDLDLEVLVEWLQPIVRGWVNYYGRFCPSRLYRALRMVDELLVRWALRKYTGRKKQTAWAWEWLKRLKSKQQTLLPHWQLVAAVG